MEGLLLLREAVGKERRPLSWTVGSQAVGRQPIVSLRDLKRPERQRATSLRTPDEI